MMTDKKQGYQPEIGITTNPPNCRSGVTPPKEDKLLIYIPKDGNYIEILGHRIDGFESFEAFCEHLKNYAVLEETVKAQKAEIEMLEKRFNTAQQVANIFTMPHKETRAEAFKEFAKAYKDQIENCTGMFTDEGFYIPRDAVLNSIDFICERLVGAEK